ncbi:hypothetical protein [Paenibacillus sp. sgz500958]|uniref:phage tail fiber protein n=1 Tax=Paenibacillus sp. sgz500958 TaxID=3242475 RepID=UPI0036D3F67C
MNLSNYFVTAALNAAFRGVVVTWPDTVYLALYTSNPTAADTGQEVTAGEYERQEITFGAPAPENYILYNLITGVQSSVQRLTIKNTGDVVAPVAESNWGTITHIGIRDAANGGNLWAFGALDNARSILVNDVFKILSGEIQIEIG